MNTRLKTSLNSKEIGKHDEYHHAGEFYIKGFSTVKDLISIRMFEYLNIAGNDNNKAEEMLLCLYSFPHPDMGAIDNGIGNCSIDQYFDFKGWRKEHSDCKGVTLDDLLLADGINRSALLNLFDSLSRAFYKSDEYDSRRYKYSNLREIRAARKFS